jgi:hypothetical protein
VERELHQRPHRVLALLRKPHERSPDQRKHTAYGDCSRDTQALSVSASQHFRFLEPKC